MTNKTRAEIVTLLRCAADVCLTKTHGGLLPSDITVARVALVLPWLHGLAAVRACDSIWQSPRKRVTRMDVVLNYLEAACRVEEGSWP